MRHVSARRASVALATLFVAVAVAFAWLVAPRSSSAGAATAQADHPGAAPYEEYCAACHTAEGLRPGIVGADAARMRELEEFLGRHGRAPDSADRLILDFLRDSGVAR